MSQASNVEVVAIKDVGATGAKCLTSYRAELTVPWSYSMPDPAPAVGEVDITFYRDDLTTRSEQPVLNATRIDFDVTGKDVVLVDDVMTTGSTLAQCAEAILEADPSAHVSLLTLAFAGE